VKTHRKPYSDTRLAKFLQRRIAEMKSRKSQAQIASEAGFAQPNMLANIKNGACRLPLDRVISLAEALDCDPARLFQLAVEQQTGSTTRTTIERIFRALLSANETEWVTEIRDASGHSDPRMTSKGRAAIRTVFGR
jgi:transcriptional regulator with XRE-family HTH domain